MAGLALAEENQPGPAAAALAFVAQQEAVSTMLVSMTQRKHLAENCAALVHAGGWQSRD